MAPKSVTFRRHDHLVSVLFGDLLSHSYNITFLMFLDLVVCNTYLFFLTTNRNYSIKVCTAIAIQFIGKVVKAGLQVTVFSLYF